MKRINLSEQQDAENSGENKTNILDFGVGGSEPPVYIFLELCEIISPSKMKLISRVLFF